MAQTTHKDSQSAIYSMKVSIGETPHEAFFEQVELFSKEHKFAYRLTSANPAEQDFFVTLWREDITIYGMNNFEPNVFTFAFFNNTENIYPSKFLEVIIDDLEIYINKNKNIIIFNEMKK